MTAKDYFLALPTGGNAAQRALYVRIANALQRGGITCMQQLCHMSAQRLRGLRNIGEHSLAVILAETEKYRSARGI